MSTHGGKREGSGPKHSVSPFGEKTSVIRVPNSLKSQVLVYLDAYKTNTKGNAANANDQGNDNASNTTNNKAPLTPLAKHYIKRVDSPTALSLPIYSGKVSAGQSSFPSPAQDYVQEELDLNKHLITNPPSTFLYRVGSTQDSMIDAGIHPNSLIVVDRSITPRSSDIVLAEERWPVKTEQRYK